MSTQGRKSLTNGGGKSPRTSFVWLPENEEALREWWRCRCPDAKTRSAALRHGLAYLRDRAEALGDRE